MRAYFEFFNTAFDWTIREPLFFVSVGLNMTFKGVW
nr:truncated Na(+)/H(+) antiporter [Lactiplantibacillus plantarum subsp. plantarum]